MMNLSLEDIRQIFERNGAKKILLKPLAENDNTKQQVYLGGSFEVIKDLPFNEVIADSSVKIQNFKARVDFYWLSQDGVFVKAPHAKLILYPSYPEVRLSGFLRGCPSAPNSYMQPVPLRNRGEKNQWDGRVLCMGVTEDGRILAHLAPPLSSAAQDFEALRIAKKIVNSPNSTLLYELHIKPSSTSTQIQLIAELTRIRALGWIDSVRLDRTGAMVPYRARNGGGYTLEAQLGIRPNGRSEPDFLGWEVKGHSTSRITLMTPEPDSGYYGVEGAEAFVRRYGYRRPDGVFYFTGTHKVNARHVRSGQLLSLQGFNPEERKIINVDGGIFMTDRADNASAVWTYPGLIEHWGRKHANAVYVRYASRGTTLRQYNYQSPVRLGIGTAFTDYLYSMHVGNIVYDPATKYTPATAESGGRVKARSQFRISSRKLTDLYQQFFEAVI